MPHLKVTKHARLKGKFLIMLYAIDPDDLSNCRTNNLPKAAHACFLYAIRHTK